MNHSHCPRLRRRQIIRSLLATTALGVSSRLWTGCASIPSLSSDAVKNDSDPNAQDITLGFIYAGAIDDSGWNQAHHEGQQGVAKLAKVKTVEQASVPETNAVQAVMQKMITEDRANALFLTSFGYFDPHLLAIAAQYPTVQFFHAGALYDSGKHPRNVGSYFTYTDEVLYLTGIVAAQTSRTGKLGFIAAKPLASVLRNINSYTLGARSVRSNITTQVLFTGDWSLPTQEANAANLLVDQGVDVLACHVDSPKVIMQTAEQRGVFCTGYHTHQAQFAPKGYLTGAEWNWAKLYSDYARLLQQGKSLMNGGISNLVRGGFKNEYIKLSDYGSAVSNATRQSVEAAKGKLNSGDLMIYRGEIRDNTGKVVIPTGQEYRPKASELEAMNWLVDGAIGNLNATVR
ncbi:BMP family ABC transporter substrate-binding protein [Pantanalinema rosaneae CENA516]|uniref:BMP family ABC transporter substrate-binding protein n=1 Tax=Pantanalinema rosaneae TaxID=1620701 RepID=UPI003D6F2B11